MEPLDDKNNMEDFVKQLFKSIFSNLDENFTPFGKNQPEDMNLPPKISSFHISFRINTDENQPDFAEHEEFDLEEDDFGDKDLTIEVPNEIQRGKPEIFTDIFDAGSEIMIVMEIPGVGKDQIDLQATSRELEITVGKNTKSIALPNLVDENSAKARFKNGILEIRLKKAQSPQVRKSKISLE